MRQFIKSALRKADKLSREQLKTLLNTTLEEMKRLENAMNSINDGLIVCDTQNKLLLLNSSAERFLHIKNTGSGKRYVWSIIEDKEISDFLQLALVNVDRIEDREFTVKKNEIEKRLAISILPLVEEHHVTGSLIIIDDITEKKESEALIRRMETLSSLTTLAAGVAHEIKNPLSSISIHIQLARKLLSRSAELCREQHKKDFESPTPYVNYGQLDSYLDVVNEEIERLNRTVIEFLYAVRPVSRELKAGNINALLYEILDFYHFELDAVNVKYTTKFSDKIPMFLFDESALKRLFLNLFKNAKEAMPDGGILSVSTKVLNNKIIISVEDTGCGIPEEDLEKIFEPYWTTKESGSGLGLLIAFKIVNEHGGEITVRSHSGEGTRFDIILPVQDNKRKMLIFKGGPR